MMDNCEETKLEPLCPKEKQEEKMTTEKPQNELQYNVLDYPPFILIISLALQNILTMVTTAMGFSAMLSDIVCANRTDPIRAQIFSTTLMMSGIATFLQSVFGIRLPMFQGPSSSFIPPLVALSRLDAWKCPETDISNTGYNISSTTAINMTFMHEAHTLEAKHNKLMLFSGSLAVAALLEIILGFTGFTGFLVKFVSPITIAATITSIGFSIINLAIKYSEKHWGISLMTASLGLIAILYLGNMSIPLPPFRKGAKRIYIFRNYPVLFAVGVGWAVAHILTVYNVFTSDRTHSHYTARTDAKIEILHLTPWFYLPYPGQYGLPTFNMAIFLGFLVATLTSMIESIGDYFAAAQLCNIPRPPHHAVSRGILIEGLAGMLSGLMGACHATTSYSGHVALIGVTKVASRIVLITAAVILFILSVLGKVAAFMATIPDPIIGGIFIVTVVIMTSVGLSTLHGVTLNSRNTLILGVALGLGILSPTWIEDNPNSIKTGNFELDQIIKIILGTDMFIAGIIAAILDNTIPGTKKERGMVGADYEEEADNQLESIDQSYKDVYEFPMLQNFLKKHHKLCKMCPFLPTPKVICDRRLSEAIERRLSEPNEKGL